MAVPERVSRILRLTLPSLYLALFLAQPLQAQTRQSDGNQDQTFRAYLVTYGPGEIYWQRFGHNAIWLQEPGGLNHAFNFGFFDFNQSNFLLRFVQGRMLYFAAALPMERELAAYQREGRSIYVQELNLSSEAYERLRAHLLWHVEPENREYLYDYFRDNCSTRLRDALDLALDGALSEHFRPLPAPQNFRDHTRRSTQTDPAYYLGLEGALGMPVDRPISRWEEMFLPAELAEAVEEFQGPDGQPLVRTARWLDKGDVEPPPATPRAVWPRYLALGLLLGIPLLFPGRGKAKVLGDGLALGWVLIAASLGAGLLAAWGLTDHQAARGNGNVLLLNPLWLLAFLPSSRRGVAVLLGLAAGLAVALTLWPGGQYMADTTALIAPVNLCLALRLWRQGSAPWSVSAGVSS